MLQPDLWFNYQNLIKKCSNLVLQNAIKPRTFAAHF